jgi:hypothetical protein
VLVDTKIIVFGGYTASNYANADLYLMELDPAKSKRMDKELGHGIFKITTNIDEFQYLCKINPLISLENRDLFFIQN